MGEKDEIRPQIGLLRNGRYRAEAILGAGGFGITYRCVDTGSGRVYAVKEYMPEAIASRDMESGQIVPDPDRQAAFLHGKKRFLEEAQILMRMKGIPSVVHVEEAFEENSTAYYVMEYLEGRTLKQVMRALGGKLPYAAAVEAVVKAGLALDEVHSRAGIFHRDISPENIMIMPDGGVKIIDFGSAKAMAVSENQQFSVVLKPGFAPPEQYASNMSQGRFTDVYALAGTFYYAASGTMIPAAPDRVMGAEYESLERLVPECGGQASEAVDRALCLDARFRTQTMREFVEGIAPGRRRKNAEGERKQEPVGEGAASEIPPSFTGQPASFDGSYSVSRTARETGGGFRTAGGEPQGEAKRREQTGGAAITVQQEPLPEGLLRSRGSSLAVSGISPAGGGPAEGTGRTAASAAWLRVKRGACAGQRFSVAAGRTVTVGRSGTKSEIRLSGHPEISGLHFKLLYAREKHCFYVIDQSVNGLYYRGIRLEKGKKYKVMPEDEIGVGSMSCVIVLEEQAAKAASAHSFIVQLEHGYDTVLENDGANLSQGQRQLLNISRAALSRAPILILDEATSSVDTRTERHIEEGMDMLMENRTTFVIAHRLSTVRKSNAIMVLEKGHIIERGTHEELLAAGGRYADLYHEIIELE